MSIFVLISKEENPYNLSLNVSQNFPGSEAGISFTLIRFALLQPRRIGVCNLSSQKSQLTESESQQHLTSNILKLELPLRLPNASFYSGKEEVLCSNYEGIESSFKGISSSHQGVCSLRKDIHEPQKSGSATARFFLEASRNY